MSIACFLEIRIRYEALKGKDNEMNEEEGNKRGHLWPSPRGFAHHVYFFPALGSLDRNP